MDPELLVGGEHSGSIKGGVFFDQFNDFSRTQMHLVSYVQNIVLKCPRKSF
jgi:hypothetical protein